MSKKNVFTGFIAGTFIFLLIVLVFSVTALWGFVKNRVSEYAEKCKLVDIQKDSQDILLLEEESDDIQDSTVNIKEVLEKSGNEEEWIDLNNDGIGDLEFELGEEGLDAEYYPLLTDYLRYDLSYSVSFMEYSNLDESVNCVYPKVKGKKKSTDYINQFFYNFAVETEEVATKNDCNAKSKAYVTYMDENILSVVFTEVYTQKDNINYECIYCYVFDMSEEEFKLQTFELKDTSDVFLTELESRCMKESTSHATYIFGNYTKDEIRDNILTSDNGLVAFYTPLGIEIGLNYDGYWCCATFKDYMNYINIVESKDIN